MVVTPVKEHDTSISQVLTPVRFNPSIKTSPNLNYKCETRLHVIGVILQKNYSKWKLAHDQGLALCTSIEAIKTRILDGKKTCYLKELKTYCDKLAVIGSIFEDITRSAKHSLGQTEALVKIDSAPKIIFRTWKSQNLIDFIQMLIERYEHETKVKWHVMRELPHATNRGDLIRWLTAWKHPQHVNSFVQLNFEFLNQELNIPN